MAGLCWSSQTTLNIYFSNLKINTLITDFLYASIIIKNKGFPTKKRGVK